MFHEIKKNLGLIVIALVLAFVAAITVKEKLKMKEEAPHLISCRSREMIVISTEKGHSWPKGSVEGCRCLLRYKDRIYVDFENREKVFCKSY